MTDSPQEQQGAEGQPEKVLSIEDRASLEKLSIFAKRSMLGVDGKIDQYKVADEIEPTILGALVKLEADRTKVGVTPTRLMEVHFPEVPKRSEVQSDDEEVLELADRVYGGVKGEVFRVLNILPNGPIQQRLSNNGNGLVLCRMKGRKGAEEVAYVTRNRKCINTDNNQPALRAANTAIEKAAILTGMSIERVPEHGKFFRGAYKLSMNKGIGAGADVVQAALEAGNGGDGNGSEGGSENGGSDE
jgi:hypothetical protein